MEIGASPSVRRFALVGDPVARSRSPAMYNAAFRSLSIPAVYLPRRVRRGSFDAALDALVAEGFSGLNVTAPHKRAALSAVDEATPVARAAGGVNTIYREGGRLVGDSTDGEGLLAALGARGVRVDGRHVVCIGSGGAVCAIVPALRRAGAAWIGIAARRPERARDIDADRCLELPALGALLSGPLGAGGIVVNTTPDAAFDAGGAGHLFAGADPETFVVDITYDPSPTSFLKGAMDAGLPAMDGLGMLLHQGALAFRRFVGRAAPLTEMANAIGHRAAR